MSSSVLRRFRLRSFTLGLFISSKSLVIRRTVMIEVEQKFSVKPTIDEALRHIGATLMKADIIDDTYYDDENVILMRSDHWLRLRNGQWQLKFPVSGCESSSVIVTATKYHDVDDAEKILPKVVSLLKAEVTQGLSSREQLEQFMRSGLLVPFLKFTSHRRTFACPGGCTVDLDQTDFGFAVGEIEKMVDSESDVSGALQDIEELASKLGITEKVRRGKIDAYLSIHNPSLLTKLIDAGVLQKP